MTPLVVLPVEQDFAALLDAAEELPTLLEELAADGLPAMVDGDDFPESTLRRLNAWAVLEYRAALLLLRHADVAHAAEVLLRGLLEFYAHVAWIHEDLPGDQRTPKTRATCLELGIAVEANDTLTKKLTGWGAPHPRVDAAAAQRLTDITAVHSAEGCGCKGHAYRDVRPTLKHLDAGGIKWPYGLWVISSAAAHQLLPGRVEVDLGDGTSDFLSVATYAWRADLLGYVVRAYGLAGVRMLDMVNTQHVDRLHLWIERFLADPRLVDASAEKFDHAAMAQMDMLSAALRERQEDRDRNT